MGKCTLPLPVLSRPQSHWGIFCFSGFCILFFATEFVNFENTSKLFFLLSLLDVAWCSGQGYHCVGSRFDSHYGLFTSRSLYITTLAWMHISLLSFSFCRTSYVIIANKRLLVKCYDIKMVKLPGGLF